MPKCTICTHPDRDAIDRDLVAGVSLKIVAQNRAASRSALFRHRREHIPADLARVAQARDLARAGSLAVQVEAPGLNVMAELELTFRRVNKLLEACDAWLTDPDDPGRYDLGPRAGEVLIRYTAAGPSGKPVQARAPLSELLARLEGCPAAGSTFVVDGIDLKTADPRELILKAARRLEAELQLVARLLGQIQEAQPTVNVLVTSPEWIATRTAILAALEPYPEARLAVAAAIAGAAGMTHDA